MSLTVKPDNPVLVPYLLRNFWLDSLLISLKNLKANQAQIDNLLKVSALSRELQSSPIAQLLTPLQLENQTTLLAAMDSLIVQTEELRNSYWPFDLQQQNESVSQPAAANAVAPQSVITEAVPTEPAATVRRPKRSVKPKAEAVTAPPKTTNAAKTPAKKSRAKKTVELPPQDLTRIKGIGPVLAEKLSENGIVRYEQIAKWSEEDVDFMENVVLEGRVTGRIDRDNWVSQAKQLAKQQAFD